MSAGWGKSVLSGRIPSILPDMSPAETLETTKVYPALGSAHGLIATRLSRAPHHTISTASLSGGGGTVPCVQECLGGLGLPRKDRRGVRTALGDRPPNPSVGAPGVRGPLQACDRGAGRTRRRRAWRSAGSGTAGNDATGAELSPGAMLWTPSC